jgi:tRNA(fMet)-specific endonuclease VapC
MHKVILDTDILSEVIKQRNQNVVNNATSYLATFGLFTFSEMTRYEIRRGFLFANATAKLPAFENFCNHSQILPINEQTLFVAANLWVLAKQLGHPCSDADLIIASTAITENCLLVSGNTRHFSWIPKLDLADWRN